MNDRRLAAEFEEHRPRLLAVATRALGSRIDAEDAVQEAWLRLHRHADDEIENLGAWLTRVVGRLCIDALRRRTARAESALDSWEVDVLVTDEAGDPESTAIAADAVGLAMLVVLESLEPEERLAFVLHDVFAVPFAEIAPIVNRSTNAAKMLASRARRKVQDQPPPTAEPGQQREVVDAFLRAAREGDFDSLLSVLDPDVTWYHHTAHGRTVWNGTDAVLTAIQNGNPDQVTLRRVSVNGQPGLLAWGPSGRPVALMACTVVAGRIVRMDSITDATRLSRMTLPSRDPSAG